METGYLQDTKGGLNQGSFQQRISAGGGAAFNEGGNVYQQADYENEDLPIE